MRLTFVEHVYRQCVMLDIETGHSRRQSLIYGKANSRRLFFRSSTRFRRIGQASLLIKDVQLEDDAEYSCRFKSPTVTLTAFAKLTVVGKLVRLFFSWWAFKNNVLVCFFLLKIYQTMKDFILLDSFHVNKIAPLSILCFCKGSCIPI